MGMNKRITHTIIVESKETIPFVRDSVPLSCECAHFSYHRGCDFTSRCLDIAKHSIRPCVVIYAKDESDDSIRLALIKKPPVFVTTLPRLQQDIGPLLRFLQATRPDFSVPTPNDDWV
jgi:hypothetical protein